MSYVQISLIVMLGIVLLANTSTIYATSDKDAQKTIVRQLTLDDLLEDNSQSLENSVSELENELVMLHEDSTNLKIAKKEINGRVGIINSLFSLYDELLQPSVISEIKKGDIDHAYSIVKSYNHVFNDIKLDSVNSQGNNDVLSSVANLNNLIPKQLSFSDILK